MLIIVKKFITWYNVDMEKTFLSYGIKISEKQAEKFNKYMELLLEYNEKFNITAITDKEEIKLKHFVDSGIGVKYFTRGKYIDIGSGGGFPAIPVKILNDDLDLTLVEATGKKCSFLQAIIKELDLKNTTVINARAEDLAKDDKYREKFDYASARAVARLNTLCEYCLPFVGVGGSFIAYKGDAEEELLESKNAIKILGGKIEKVERYSLDDAKRTLIEIKKVSTTNIKYPRANGQIKKKPL